MELPPILSAAAVRRLEEAAIAKGVSAETLMDRAGEECARRLRHEYPAAREALCFIGKGNNGGDGLVIARHLAAAEWTVSLVLPFPALGPLCRKKFDALLREFPGIAVYDDVAGARWPGADGLVIDALLGIGAKGALAEPLREAVLAINRERLARFFRVAAIDGPTGLHRLAEGAGEEAVIAADLTLGIGFGKESFFREEWSGSVGRIALVPIFDAEAMGEVSGVPRALEPRSLRALLPRRSAKSHKNDFGRVVVIGGSRGTVGAPLLSTLGALRVGAGLVHVAVRSEVFSAAAALAPPEAMVVAAADGSGFGELLAKADSIALGPGLGTDHDAVELLRRVLRETKVPLVVDADGLTLLSRDPALLAACRGRAVLTPHPGEMGRLLGGKFPEAERPERARAFAEAHGVVVVLKGTRTVVAEPGSPVALNTTGNPGLAAGGSGDLLAGIVAGLLGQRLGRGDAARLGVWLHGRAADLALRARGAEEGLGPVETAGCLSAAIAELRFG